MSNAATEFIYRCRFSWKEELGYSRFDWTTERLNADIDGRMTCGIHYLRTNDDMERPLLLPVAILKAYGVLTILWKCHQRIPKLLDSCGTLIQLGQPGKSTIRRKHIESKDTVFVVGQC